MGTANALSMAENVADGSISLERALEWHLTVNHYPPVPLEALPTAICIIETQGEWGYDDTIELPEGLTWRGLPAAPIGACIEEWHLDSFLEHAEEEW